MSDSKAMEQRLRAYLKRSEIETTETSIGWALAFAFDEVRAALAPREVSPELAEAEMRLRRESTTGHDCVERRQCGIIADELDRLRAALAAEKVASETFRQAACLAAELKVAEIKSQPAPAQDRATLKRIEATFAEPCTRTMLVSRQTDGKWYVDLMGESWGEGLSLDEAINGALDRLTAERSGKGDAT